jgi:hypothetical protein
MLVTDLILAGYAPHNRLAIERSGIATGLRSPEGPQLSTRP